MNMKTFIGAAAITLCALSASSAFAVDAKGYNGSICKAARGSQASQIERGYYGIRNLGPTVLITCPILQDELNNTRGTNGIWLWTTLALSTDEVFCVIYSLDIDGRILTLASRTHRSGWFTFNNIARDSWTGNYVINCSLPHLGTLNGIWIQERS